MARARSRRGRCREGGQQRRAIDLQSEKIADYVTVLGAVHAMNQRSARIRICRSGAVELGFQIIQKPLICGLIRTRKTRAKDRAG